MCYVRRAYTRAHQCIYPRAPTHLNELSYIRRGISRIKKMRKADDVYGTRVSAREKTLKSLYINLARDLSLALVGGAQNKNLWRDSSI